MNERYLPNNVGRFEALLLASFVFSVIFGPAAGLFFFLSIYHIASRTAPKDIKSADFIAYACILSVPLLIATGMFSELLSAFSQIFLLIVLAAVDFVVLSRKPIMMKFDRSCLNFLAILISVIAVFSPSFLIPGSPTQDGAFVSFLYTNDSWWHASIASYIFNGNWPPINTHLPGQPFLYYWFGHVWLATGAKLLGFLDFMLAFRLLPLLTLAAVTGGAWLLSKRFFDNPTFPTALTLLSGPLAAFYLGIGGKLLGFPYIEFLSEWKPQTLGLALLFSSLAFYISYLKDGRRSNLAYTLALLAFLPGVHFLTFPVFVVAAGTYTVFYRISWKPLKLNIRLNDWLFLASCIMFALHASGLYTVHMLSNIGSTTAQQLGAQSTDMNSKYTDPAYVIPSTLLAIFGFFGIPLLCLIFLIPSLPCLLHQRDFFLLSAMLAAILTVGVLGDLSLISGAKMTWYEFVSGRKFFNIIQAFFVLPVSYAILRRTQRPAILLLIIALTAAPTVAGVWLKTVGTQPAGLGPITVSNAELESFDWIRSNTATDALFLIKPAYLLGTEDAVPSMSGTRYLSNHPLPTYTGRAVLLGSDVYAVILAKNISNIEERITIARTVYESGDVSLLRPYGINYVYIGPRELARWPNASFNLPVAYDRNGIKIYQIE